MWLALTAAMGEKVRSSSVAMAFLLSLSFPLDGRGRDTRNLDPIVFTPEQIPYLAENVTIEREAKLIGDAEMIILHKASALLPRNRTYSGKTFEELLKGNPSDHADDGWVITDETPWSDPANKERFNCHAYATHEFLGLNVDDWLEGDSSPLTNNTNPLGTAVANFCTRRSRLRIDSSSWKVDLTRDEVKRLRGRATGRDTLLMAIETDAGGKTVYLHTGIPLVKRGIVFMKSKLGEGPLFAMSLDSLVEEYKKFRPDHISVYACRKPD